MEENRSVFNHIKELIALYGFFVLIFIVFSAVVGDMSKDYSSLFELGSQGLSINTLLQLLLLAAVITALRIVFLTDICIKNMKLPVRTFLFFGIIIGAIVIFVIVFSWFPSNDPTTWVAFFVCFGICTAISVGISRLKEKLENRSMKKALDDFNKEI